MRKALLFVALCFTALCQAQVGSWKAYMSYYDTQNIVKADNSLFVRASNSLYQYNLNDHSITTYDRSHQLNGTSVSKIGWNGQAKRLLVYYSDANIDLIDLNGNVTNISSIYSKAMTRNKNLNTMYMYEDYAFLSMNFGVVKVNMRRGEIAETYMLEKPISHTTIIGNNIFARHVTDKESGCLKADIRTNLIDLRNWEEVGNEGMPSQIYNTNEGNATEEYKELVATLNPGGPKTNFCGSLMFKDGKLYTCSNAEANGVVRQGTVQVLENSEWSFLQDDMTGVDGTDGANWAFSNTAMAAVDPRDNKHVMVAAREGLFEYYGEKLQKYYHKDNSILNPATSSNRYVIVSGALYDSSGNLWMMQSQVPENSIMEISADGEWHSYYTEELMDKDNKSLARLGSLILDSRGLLWFVNNHYDTPSFYSFNTKTKKLVNATTTLKNQDGVIYDIFYPYCITEDMDGNLWLGTNRGLFEIEASTASGQLDYVTQVKVPRNDGTNYADYLMDGVGITCIAVDQANRKWLGTNGAGLYLISADNMEQLENFTSENSPLLSDNIESIAINHETGEVFIGTDVGLCSYMSDATAVSIEMTKDDVYAYPNPVVSGYNGLITIVGLTRDADVKILTVNGQLVAQGRSNGGSFSWNGRDSHGNRVASGVYMVATAKSDGSKGTVCKIAVIR